MALALHRLDPRYAWRSVQIIAVEDVGLGSPDVVLWSTAAQRSAFRKSVGEVLLLIAVTRCMAKAVKSRAAVELSFVTETSEPEMFRLFGGMTTDQLLDRFGGSDPYEAYAAVSVLRGIVPIGYRIRPPDQRGTQCAYEMLPDLVRTTHLRSVQAALLHPLDNMSLGYVVVARLEPDDLERQDEMFTSWMIDGYPAEAYDQHERLGRRSIRTFAERVRSVSAPLRRLSRAKAAAAVADAVFVIEGQCLDRWVGGIDLDRLRQQADRFSLTRHGVSEGEEQEVRELVASRLDELHHIRTMIVTDAQ